MRNSHNCPMLMDDRSRHSAVHRLVLLLNKNGQSLEPVGSHHHTQLEQSANGISSRLAAGGMEQELILR
ncbi:hypothetical protein AAVH_13197 [Aphelenchoides avenae]|nr:hypothetical protein AAVH_13197 [Aphelenchus avenae]